jgi:hypothetical protein
MFQGAPIHPLNSFGNLTARHNQESPKPPFFQEDLKKHNDNPNIPGVKRIKYLMDQYQKKKNNVVSRGISPIAMRKSQSPLQNV